MRPVFRFALPIVAALLVGAGVIGVLSVQVNLSTDKLRSALSRIDVTVPVTGFNTTPSVPSADSGDAALLALRRGDLDALAKNWADAELAYRDAVAKGGGLTAEKKLALVLLQRRKFDEAATMISDLQAKGMRAEDVLLLQSLSLLRTGKTADALQMLTAAPDSPQKHYALALAAIVQGASDTAQAEIAKVLDGFDPALRQNAQVLQTAFNDYAKFPGSTEGHLDTLLARSLALVNECELALPMLSSVIGQVPEYRDAWILQGFCEEDTERYSEARASFEHAYTLDPEKPEIQYFLGKTYLALNDLENAATFLQYALKNGLNPAKEARKTLSDVFQKQGKTAEAFQQLTLIADAPDATRDDVLACGTMAVSVKKVPEFMPILQRAITKWPDDAGLHVAHARLSLSQGSRDEAKAAFQKVLELDPTNAEAQQALSKL